MKRGTLANSCVVIGPKGTPKDDCAAAKLGALCATKPIEVKIMSKLILQGNSKLVPAVTSRNPSFIPHGSIGKPSIVLSSWKSIHQCMWNIYIHTFRVRICPTNKPTIDHKTMHTAKQSCNKSQKRFRTHIYILLRTFPLVIWESACPLPKQMVATYFWSMKKSPHSYSWKDVHWPEAGDSATLYKYGGRLSQRYAQPYLRMCTMDDGRSRAERKVSTR